MRFALAAVGVTLAWVGSAKAQFGPTHLPACHDGVDNDGDGKRDFDPNPASTTADPGCDSWNDDDEADIVFTPKLKARIAIIFDTSGSMTWDVCGPESQSLTFTGGDGSTECPGNDVACCGSEPCCTSPTCGDTLRNDARLFKVKRGVYDAVAAYGELEYSLYRFNQQPRAWAGCAGFNDQTYPMGGWAGALTGENSGCGGLNHADRLVKFAPENQRSILQWMDNQDNWDDGNNRPPSGHDYELRGSGFTPIAGSIDTVRVDLTALRAADERSCRPYRIVLVTDGDDRCAANQGIVNTAAANANMAGFKVNVIGFASASRADDMNDIAQFGGTGAAILVDTPETLSAALAQIAQETVLVETCNNMDDDCDGVPDNGFNKGPCNNGQQGACFRPGTFECTPDGTGTFCNAPHVTPPSGEPPGCNGIDDDCDGIIDDGLQCTGCGEEICNGRDDDCDGETDEGDLPGEGVECGFTEGVCQAGHYECEGGHMICKDAIGPSSEICDGKDNNCDGVIDMLIRACYTFPTGCVDTNPNPNIVNFQCNGRCHPGSQTCTLITQPAYGTCLGEVGPIPEVCNGQDDNCDGEIDEGFEDLGKECETGTGLCKTKGKFVCSTDGEGLVCDAPVIGGSGEVCNGIDDDCNGIVDDLPLPLPSPIGEPCGTCGGVYECRGGLVCTGGSSNQETCNNMDDDCNGIVDDGILPGVGEPCVPLKDGVPEFTVAGECKAGRRECINGGLTCIGFTGPQLEVCNGKDDDCDGVGDDMAACPSQTDACYQSQCVSPCAEGEFPCPFGYFCKMLGSTGRFCVPNPCTGKVCSTNEICDTDTGMCKDPCIGVECPSGTQCSKGRCVDCFTLGCPAGQVCIDNASHIGVCTVDHCVGVTCGAGKTCKEGTCTDVACADGCKAGELCQDGECVARCSADLCFGATCADGQICNASTGRCAIDPCARTNCGSSTCFVTCEGEATCGLKAGVDVLATGSGGFQCEIGSVSSRSGRAVPWLLLIGVAAMVASRRRRR